MKKIALAALTAAALFAFASCGKKDSDSITIGGIFPLSGNVSVYGVECKNGIDLAIEEINAAGGVNGKKLVLVSEDDEGNPDKTGPEDCSDRACRHRSGHHGRRRLYFPRLFHRSLPGNCRRKVCR